VSVPSSELAPSAPLSQACVSTLRNQRGGGHSRFCSGTHWSGTNWHCTDPPPSSLSYSFASLDETMARIRLNESLPKQIWTFLTLSFTLSSPWVYANCSHIQAEGGGGGVFEPTKTTTKREWASSEVFPLRR
jgi:hypothetical protein